MICKTIEFKSKDGLTITANEYKAENPRDYIVLCHRSHFNRGEYQETAPRLKKLGFSCLAIDQRSGMQVLGVKNETYARAKEQGMNTGYYSAKLDIEAAVDYAYKKNKSKVILLGSSYSASLSLLVALEKYDKIKSVIAYSPGEYFKNINVRETISNLKLPIYVTSSKEEVTEISKLIEYVDKKYLTHFKPSVEGGHGSRVLWEKSKGSKEYFDSLTKFLNSIR
jgi:pimeloyl-ACP methyl ester carboxylesterase